MQSFNGTSQINTFIKGMNMDLDKSIIPKDTYRYAENIRLVVDNSGNFGALQGIEGMSKYNLLYGKIGDNPDDQTAIDNAKDITNQNIIGVSNVREYGVVITEHLVDGVWNNSIYRLDFDGADLRVIWVTTQPLNMGYPDDGTHNIEDFHTLSITNKWENLDNFKIYIADGYHHIRIVNLSDAKLDESRNAVVEYFEVVPKGILTAPKFIRFLRGGKLKSGKICYYYQLFIPNGQISAVSPASNLIQLTSSNVGDINFKGTDKGNNVNKSIQISVDTSEVTAYSYIRLYSVYYEDNYSTPAIKIVTESELNKDIDENVFIDSGNFLSEITLEEFTSFDNYNFIPRVLESKDNILFAGNIVEDTWNLPNTEDGLFYDTRSFSFRSNGSGLLKSRSSLTSDISFTSDDLNLPDDEYISKFPINHDCINPANEDLAANTYMLSTTGNRYVYNSDATNWGGSGRNVDFKMAYTILGEDPKVDGNTVDILMFPDNEDAGSSSVYKGIGGLAYDIKLLSSFGNTNYNIRPYLPIWHTTNTNVLTKNDWVHPTKKMYYIPDDVEVPNSLNYSNEYIESIFKGYQRDSVYRFGVVFYNEAGQTTPVSWIADVRTPCANEINHRLFDMNSIIPLEDLDSGEVRGRLFGISTYPLGIEFSFKNVSKLKEAGVSYIEIVRCERTIEDRNVITQGLISRSFRQANSQNTFTSLFPTIGKYNNHRWVGFAEEDSSEEIPQTYNWRPFEFAHQHQGVTVGNTPVIDPSRLFTFTSPELDISREEFISYINENDRPQLELIYGLSSVMQNSITYNNPNATEPQGIYNTIIYGAVGSGNTPTLISHPNVSHGNSEYGRYRRYLNDPFNSYDDEESTTYVLAIPTTLDMPDGGYSSKDQALDQATNEDGIGKVGFTLKMYNPFNAVQQGGSGGYTEPRTDILSGYGGYMKDITYPTYRDGIEGGPNDPNSDGYVMNINGWSYYNWAYKLKWFKPIPFAGPAGPELVFSIGLDIPPHQSNDRVKLLRNLINGGTPQVGKYTHEETDYVATTYFDATTFEPVDKAAARIATICTTYLCNIKKDVMPYGGLDYLSRSGNTYVTTGCGVAIKDAFISKGNVIVNQDDIDNDRTNIITFGGDTYIGIHSHVSTHTGYDTDSPGDYDHIFPNTTNVMYPCESSVNMSLLHGAQWQDLGNRREITYESGLEAFKSPLNTGFVQSEAFYGYNSAYSANNIAVSFFTKLQFSKDDNHIDYRIMYSEPKINEELTDSWSKFKSSNYLDLDTRYGSVNNMKVFNANLYAWQDNAFGMLQVNPRSLISDNLPGALILGTGGVLERINYITINNGSKKNVINNIGITPSLMFWYDHDRAEIVSYYGTVDTTSKLYGIQSNLNSSKGTVSDHVITTYDQKYNDAHIVLEKQNGYDHFLLNEQIRGFTSFLTYKPQWFINNGKDLLSVNKLIDTNIFYRNNSNIPNQLFNDTVDSSIVRFIVNDNFQHTKVFDNIKFYADNVRHSDYLSGDTVVRFETSNQVSNTVSYEDIKKREETYRFVIPREASSYSGRMRGKWIEETYTITPDTNNFNLPYIETIYRISNL